MLNFGKCFANFRQRSDVEEWNVLTDVEYAYAKILYEIPSWWRNVGHQLVAVVISGAKWLSEFPIFLVP